MDLASFLKNELNPKNREAMVFGPIRKLFDILYPQNQRSKLPYYQPRLGASVMPMLGVDPNMQGLSQALRSGGIKALSSSQRALLQKLPIETIRELSKGVGKGVIKMFEQSTRTLFK